MRAWKYFEKLATQLLNFALKYKLTALEFVRTHCSPSANMENDNGYFHFEECLKEPFLLRLPMLFC